jgi:acetyl-CoA carboxylase carboxyltransferase component
MKLSIRTQTTREEAEAIATALAEHLDTAIEIELPDGAIVSVGHSEDRSQNEEKSTEVGGNGGAGPTDREKRIRDEIEDILQGGPEAYKESQREAGKLFVRDRLELWFDELLFEDGRYTNFDADERLPADGLVTGGAEFEGRNVHVIANDYTVKAGSRGRRGIEKFLQAQHRALRSGQPLLYLIDSSGGRIDQQSGFYANREGGGKTFYNQSMLSGYVPQIGVVYGPSMAGGAYIPVFTDFVVMVEGSAMAIASPRMVEMVTNEDVSMQDLGGPHVHAEHSGSAHLIADDEQHARDLVAQLVGYLPASADEDPPRSEPEPPSKSPKDIDAVIPQEPNKPYQMEAVIDRVVDADSYLELQPDYGKEIITAFARIDGYPVGIVANQPDERAGAIFPDAAEKAASFIWKCDAFDVPLLYLCDTPGFMAGSQVEKEGILKQGKKMVYATSEATVQKQCIVVRKGYGAGIFAMGGPAYEPESVLALPSGEIAVMGPEAAINAVYRNELEAIDDPDRRAERERELREEYRKDIDVHRMASDAIIDDIIPPSELRTELERRIGFYDPVEKRRPDKKHGTML